MLFSSRLNVLIFFRMLIFNNEYIFYNEKFYDNILNPCLHVIYILMSFLMIFFYSKLNFDSYESFNSGFSHIENYRIIERRSKQDVIYMVFGEEKFSLNWLNPFKSNSLLKIYKNIELNKKYN